MIVVTGGSGFIGSVLVRQLSQNKQVKVVVVDRLESDEKWKNLRKSYVADFIHADKLFEKDDLFWNQVKSIYHLGACSSTTQKNVDYLMENNFEYSKRIFQIAAEFKIPLLYASSAATYGDGESGYKDDHQLSNGLSPLNPYGYSKKLFDDWALSQGKSPERWIGIKFFNVFGPNEYHKGRMRSVVKQAYEQISENGSVKLFKSYLNGVKDGEQVRDFIYVKDAVRAMIDLMSLPAESKLSGLFNLGTGQGRTFNDLVYPIFESLQKKVNINYIDMPEDLKKQYQYYTQADMTKFFKVLPEFKFMSLEDSVKDYVEQHLMKVDTYV